MAELSTYCPHCDAEVDPSELDVYWACDVCGGLNGPASEYCRDCYRFRDDPDRVYGEGEF